MIIKNTQASNPDKEKQQESVVKADKITRILQKLFCACTLAEVTHC